MEKNLNDAPKVRYFGAAIFVVFAITIAIIGQPTTLDRWNRFRSKNNLALDQRSVQIHPGELAPHDP